LYYQYYVMKDGQDIRESFYNFEYTGSDNSLAERRAVTPAAATFTVEDIVDSKTVMNRMPTFRNLSVLARNVRVTWVCDLRPAYYQTLKGDTLFDIQGSDHIYDPATVYTSGLWMNGPATGGWTTWGQTLRDDAPKRMYDDGTNGDAVAGDHFYTVQFLYGPDSTGSKKFVGQEFKFGIKGGDNEGGQGGFGNNHYENIDDSQAEVTINTAFGSINPKYYDGWDYNTGTPTSVDRLGGAPVVYRLDQNYPNPFNPSTNITYSVPASGWVTLKVFNALGQYMTTLVSGPAEAGDYRVQFDASGFESGVYMYELSVNGFRQTRTMTLVK
ncbi:MAG: T9SS type A sorting domain-containing protein, partial [Ignavibacteriae bacterium]|nr:T9SS type A sorting domain-containing protein [Ignavibacteriota bacterium]